MPTPLRLDGVLAKVQPTSGTDAAPSNTTDGVRLARRLWSSITVDHAWQNDRHEAASGSIVPLKPAIPRGRHVRLDIFWEAKGAGSDAVCEAAALFRACGMTEPEATPPSPSPQASAPHERPPSGPTLTASCSRSSTAAV